MKMDEKQCHIFSYLFDKYLLNADCVRSYEPGTRDVPKYIVTALTVQRQRLVRQGFDEADFRQQRLVKAMRCSWSMTQI